MSALGSLGHHFGKDLAKVAKRVFQGAEKASQAPLFGDPFGYLEGQFWAPLFCMFLGHPPRTAFGQVGSPKGLKKEAFGGPFGDLCRNCENLDF